MIIQIDALQLSDILYGISRPASTDVLIAVIGSFFGAAGGYFMVWAATRRKETLNRIAALNNATMLVHNVYQTVERAWNSHSSRACGEFKSSRKAFKLALKNQTSFPLQLQLKEFKLTYINLDYLEKTLFETVVLNSFQYDIASKLLGSLHELNRAYEIRKTSAEMLEAIIDPIQKAHFYYGEPWTDKNGHVFHSTEYLDCMNAIEDYRKSCLLFATQLSAELTQSSKKLTKTFWVSRPRSVAFQYPSIDGLI